MKKNAPQHFLAPAFAALFLATSLWAESPKDTTTQTPTTAASNAKDAQASKPSASATHATAHSTAPCWPVLPTLPAKMSHASIPQSLKERMAPPADLVRLSLGIEDVDDLVNDLAQALDLIAE